MKPVLSFLIGLVLVSQGAPGSANTPGPKPNTLVILTDDLGLSDPGCYGSEIATPDLDRLAANGLRFTQFCNTAKCHSSRVSLLSGRWCRQAGDESLRRAVTIPEVLAPAGHFTAMTGNVPKAPKKDCAPVTGTATDHRHPEGSNYTDAAGARPVRKKPKP